jgi:hypothetical protein
VQPQAHQAGGGEAGAFLELAGRDPSGGVAGTGVEDERSRRVGPPHLRPGRREAATSCQVLDLQRVVGGQVLTPMTGLHGHERYQDVQARSAKSRSSLPVAAAVMTRTIAE